MNKDISTFQISCALQELYHLNDAVINGDLTSKGALTQAQQWADDLKTHLLKLEGLRDVWVSPSVTYGGVINLAWEITWADGEVIRGNATPCRK